MNAELKTQKCLTWELAIEKSKDLEKNDLSHTILNYDDAFIVVWAVIEDNSTNNLAGSFTGSLERGISLHNRLINKSGVILDGSISSSISVMTVAGKERWHIDNCEPIQDIE